MAVQPTPNKGLPVFTTDDDRLFHRTEWNDAVIAIDEAYDEAAAAQASADAAQADADAAQSTAEDALLAGDKTFRHVQDSAQAVWTISHAMEKYPSIHAFDSSGRPIIGDVVHVNEDLSELRFQSAISGVAHCN